MYFGDMHCVIFSDIPNNRLLRFDEMTGEPTVFRQPSNNANGNTRDRQGRLVTCEHAAGESPAPNTPAISPCWQTATRARS